jgi:hypothetical protein
MVASSSSSPDANLHRIVHSLTTKLTPLNYLLWKSQVTTVLALNNLLHHVDGTNNSPPPVVTSGDKTATKPEYTTWLSADLETCVILQASLSEEAAMLVVNLPTARQIWTSLEAAFGNTSIERVHTLRDQLRLTQKGSKTVAEYTRMFKSLCDQLAAIDHPVDADDQVHWYLCGLGPTFKNFSTSVRSNRPPPSISDLMIRAESHKLFLRALHGPATSAVAFSADR